MLRGRSCGAVSASAAAYQDLQDGYAAHAAEASEVDEASGCLCPPRSCPAAAAP